MQSNQLDLFGSVERPGFRLDRVEVYNWGTFHKNVWSVNAARGQNLLTGDVGSGKSSLVDALTTLLVPPNRIIFNKAAGSEKQERSLYTYIRGAYGNEQDPESNSSRLLTLRDETSYSVILAVFVNESIQRTITLAQVFRVKKNEKNPDRFYVMANDALGIETHFFAVKKDISDIKSTLKKHEGCEVFDSFKEYSTRFRQEFGIKSEQALDLFYQAVSMKSVGNLTEFVRQHMLEKTGVEPQIEELCASFEDLRSAHEAILKARHQVELLQPIVDLGARYEQDQVSKESFTQQRDFLYSFFAARKEALLQESLVKLQERLDKAGHRSEKLKTNLAEERQNHFQLNLSLNDKGGGRVQKLEAEIQQKETEKTRRLGRAEHYKNHCEIVSLTFPQSADDFVELRTHLQRQKSILQEEKLEEEKRFVELKVAISNLQKNETIFKEEIESLKTRESNIPVQNLRLRAELARSLGLDEKELPFAGELLQVKSSEKKWEGAIERVLRNLGLSLLVSENHYAAVSRYVNETHLKGKLVYFKVQNDKKAVNRYSPQSLAAKMDIRRDSAFFDWLRNELESHFNFECCETLEDFQRSPKALSLSGQMKVSAKKHEKDDRFAINDRSRFVLGWSNKEKIRSLRESLERLQEEGRALMERLQAVEEVRENISGRQLACDALLHFQSFEEIHWQSLAEDIQKLENEIRKIRQESDILDTLKKLIVDSKEKIDTFEKKLEEVQKEEGRLANEITSQEESLRQARELALSGDETLRARLSPQIEALATENGILQDLTLANLDKRQTDLRGIIQSKLDALVKAQDHKQAKIIGGIKDFLHHYREFSVNVDASVQSLPELKNILQNLVSEDLPRHEARFYKKLKEDTINGMAMFQELLEKERRLIENKIQVINTCLRDLDYNAGTYICILPNKTVDQEIVHFRNDLRLVLSNTAGPDSVYTEQKFLEVKNMIDRLRGRPQFLDVDKKWTAKVTDVRNWFTFAASERYHADNTEKEFYPDSGGKSGGQKEKLAYTVLASALAYQYGIEASQDTPKSFRFVMIDEAFGRGSDESARYGLTLFEKLNLQLLVVTPLQKIHVMEDYVDYVHLVHNQSSKESKIHSLTIEQFREERLKRLKVAGGDGVTFES